MLGDASDPEPSGDEAAILRERMQRAGLLEEPESRSVRRPPLDEVAAARRAAGASRPLSALVSDGRE